MTKDEAFSLFNNLIQAATEELFTFTLNSHFSVDKKADNSVVTGCDKSVNERLVDIASKAGLQIISEEGQHNLEILKSGNYITIDPIDGTQYYIDNVNYALEHGGIQNFLKSDPGPQYDFGLLLGIVENGIPTYAAVYNYITKEKFLIDGSDKNNLIHEGKGRIHTAQYGVYPNQKILDDPIVKAALAVPGSSLIIQATFGLRTIYAVLNDHKAAVVLHIGKAAGLWDVVPAAVAVRAFGGKIYDDQGSPLELTKYIMLPGNGATMIKGKEFAFIEDHLKKRK